MLQQDILTDKRLNQALMDSLPYAAMLIHKDRIILAANKLAREIGVEVGTNCWNTFGKLASIRKADKEYFEQHHKGPDCGTKCHFCMAEEALSSQKTVHLDVQADDIVWDTYWVPLNPEIYLHYAIDVTKERS